MRVLCWERGRMVKWLLGPRKEEEGVVTAEEREAERDAPCT